MRKSKKCAGQLCTAQISKPTIGTQILPNLLLVNLSDTRTKP